MNIRMSFFMIAIGGVLIACAPKEASPTSLADAAERVADGLRVKTPPGAGPFPTVLYFHGASDTSWHPEQQRILDGFAAKGFAAVFVDMYHGRGIDGRAVRSGALLPRTTAGDVMVAVDWVERQPWAARGRIGLFGISFGAATIMDALVLDAPGKVPASLERKPARGLRDVRGVALLSPWCAKDVFGFNLIRAVHEDFSRTPAILSILPLSDSVSDVNLCKDILERNKAKGAPIEIVSVSGAGHTFAQMNDDYGNRFEDHDPGKSKEAWRRIHDFFERQLK